VVDATFRPLYPAGKESRCFLYRRLGGSQGRSGRLRKTSPHRDSVPRPSSPYCSRYSDYTTPAHRPAVYFWYQLREPTFSMFRIYPVRKNLAIVLRLPPVRVVTRTFEAIERMGPGVGHYCCSDCNYVMKIADGKFGSVGSSFDLTLRRLMSYIYIYIWSTHS